MYLISVDVLLCFSLLLYGQACKEPYCSCKGAAGVGAYVKVSCASNNGIVITLGRVLSVVGYSEYYCACLLLLRGLCIILLLASAVLSGHTEFIDVGYLLFSVHYKAGG
jgi:hypothetical protein